ncbi:MAG: YihA family ribosome biogenesis GTP-binding protein [Deltaproteobacteria bacterium]|nr:MAG: YihA family ribosome biogenesis GTP-binding protein [Deltaproteobacteria bacterium]
MKVRTVRLLKTIYAPEQVEDPGYPQVAIAGRSNVGKSSLLNNLLGRQKLARVSQTPGCTRSINYYLVNDSFLVADLPGYGFAKVPGSTRKVWKLLMDEYFRRVRNLRGVFVLADSKRGLEKEERILLEFLEGKGVPAVVVFTKVDRLTQKEKARLSTGFLGEVVELTGREPILSSARTGEGKNKILRTMREMLESEIRG